MEPKLLHLLQSQRCSSTQNIYILRQVSLNNHVEPQTAFYKCIHKSVPFYLGSDMILSVYFVSVRALAFFHPLDCPVQTPGPVRHPVSPEGSVLLYQQTCAVAEACSMQIQVNPYLKLFFVTQTMCSIIYLLSLTELYVPKKLQTFIRNFYSLQDLLYLLFTFIFLIFCIHIKFHYVFV